MLPGPNCQKSSAFLTKELRLDCALVEANSIFFTPPQAAEFIHCVASPLQIRTASLVLIWFWVRKIPHLRGEKYVYPQGVCDIRKAAKLPTAVLSGQKPPPDNMDSYFISSSADGETLRGFCYKVNDWMDFVLAKRGDLW